MEPTEYTSFHWYSFLFSSFLENKCNKSNEIYEQKLLIVCVAFVHKFAKPKKKKNNNYRAYLLLFV